jgi:hypothetical protein
MRIKWPPDRKIVFTIGKSEKYHMGPLIRCGAVVGEARARARVSASPTFLADLPIGIKCKPVGAGPGKGRKSAVMV